MPRASHAAQKVNLLAQDDKIARGVLPKSGAPRKSSYSFPARARWDV
jgi:hypothetical protein